MIWAFLIHLLPVLHYQKEWIFGYGIRRGGCHNTYCDPLPGLQIRTMTSGYDNINLLLSLSRFSPFWREGRGTGSGSLFLFAVFPLLQEASGKSESHSPHWSGCCLAEGQTHQQVGRPPPLRGSFWFRFGCGLGRESGCYYKPGFWSRDLDGIYYVRCIGGQRH